MMRLVGSLSLTAFLVSCGADGMPTRPEAKEQTETGVTSEAVEGLELETPPAA